MIHIQSITDIRQNLPRLIRQMVDPIIIVQNSKPSAVIIPYKDFLKLQENEEQEQFLSMVKKSPSYGNDDGDQRANYRAKDVKPFDNYGRTSL